MLLLLLLRRLTWFKDPTWLYSLSFRLGKQKKNFLCSFQKIPAISAGWNLISSLQILRTLESSGSLYSTCLICTLISINLRRERESGENLSGESHVLQIYNKSLKKIMNWNWILLHMLYICETNSSYMISNAGK